MNNSLNLKNKNINDLILSYIQGNLNTKELLEQAKIEVLDYLKSQLNEEELKTEELKNNDPLYQLSKIDKVYEKPEILKELREILPTLAINKRGGFYNIVGGAGSGKTSFLLKIIKFLIKKDAIKERDVTVFVTGERKEDVNAWKTAFPKANINIIDLSLVGKTNDDLYKEFSNEIKLELYRDTKIIVLDSITKSLKFIDQNPLVKSLSNGLASGGINMTSLDYFTSIISTLLRCTYDGNNLIQNKLLLTTSLDSISNKGTSLIKEEIESISLGEIFLNKEIGIDLKRSYTRYNDKICNEKIITNINEFKENYSNEDLNSFFNEIINETLKVS